MMGCGQWQSVPMPCRIQSVALLRSCASSKREVVENPSLAIVPLPHALGLGLRQVRGALEDPTGRLQRHLPRESSQYGLAMSTKLDKIKSSGLAFALEF